MGAGMKWFLIIFFLFMGGCMLCIGGSEETRSRSRQTPEQRCEQYSAKVAVEGWYKQNAFDYDAMQYRNWRYTRLPGSCKYRVRVETNGKNRFGGYTGWKVQNFHVSYSGYTYTVGKE